MRYCFIVIIIGLFCCKNFHAAVGQHNLIFNTIAFAGDNSNIVQTAVAVDSDSDNCGYRSGKSEIKSSAERKHEETELYTDNTSGLMWTRNANLAGAGKEWDDAVNWIRKISLGGYSDWRLPTKMELEALVIRGGVSPYEWLNSNGFNNVQSYYYWTGSVDNNSINIDQRSEETAWSINMIFGHMSLYSKVKNYFYVWPVRDVIK